MASQKKATITIAQAETIYNIFEGGWRMSDFAPREVFPGRNNADNAARRVCRTLERKGLLKRVPIQPYDDRPHLVEGDKRFRLALTEEAIQAFRDYAVSVEYEFPWRS